MSFYSVIKRSTELAAKDAEIAAFKDEIDRQDKEIEAKDAEIVTLQGVIDRVRGFIESRRKGEHEVGVLLLLGSLSVLLPPTGGES